MAQSDTDLGDRIRGGCLPGLKEVASFVAFDGVWGLRRQEPIIIGLGRFGKSSRAII